jgi:cell division protein FtsB
MTTTPIIYPTILVYLCRFLPYMFAMYCILANMRDFSKRRGTEVRHFLQTLGWVLLLLVIAVVAVRAAWGMYGKFAEAAASDDISQKQLAAMQEQQAQVTSAVESFTSSRGLEAQMRERYGVVKPGEGQIQIVRDSASTTPQGVPSENIFIRAWHALFGWI